VGRPSNGRRRTAIAVPEQCRDLRRWQLPRLYGWRQRTGHRDVQRRWPQLDPAKRERGPQPGRAARPAQRQSQLGSQLDDNHRGRRQPGAGQPRPDRKRAQRHEESILGAMGVNMKFVRTGRNAAFTLASLALLIPPWSAAAATQDGRFAVEGPGQAMCSRILQAKDRNTEEYARYIGFVEGYLSAANRYEPNTFDLTPWHTSQALSLIMVKHCESHPNDLLGVVVQQLVVAMMPLRLASYSSMERIEAGPKIGRP